jgi:hypothetical protein
MNPSESESARDPLEQLAEAFLARYRRGERPSLAEYAEAHPELAGDIRDLFPALVAIEALKSGPGERTGTYRSNTYRPRDATSPTPARLGEFDRRPSASSAEEPLRSGFDPCSLRGSTVPGSGPFAVEVDGESP